MSKSVAKSTAAMAVATLSSRVTGLLRTWMMAFALGNTVITSAYQVANNMPNVIFDFVAGGLLGAAFIPIFMVEKEKFGKDGSNHFSCNILNLTIVILGALSILATIFAPQVIATQTFTVGETAEVTELSILFFRIFAFQILFYGISGVLTAYLNAERVYFMPAFAPAINNIVVIGSFIAYAVIAPTDQFSALIVLGIGTTLGVVVQCLMQIPSLIRSNFKWKPVFNLKDPALIAALKIAIPTFIYIVGMLIAFTCRNAFSLQATDKGPATILYAWTWFQLPYGVIAVSLSRTMFTEMSEASAQKANNRLRNQVNFGLSTTLLLIIPMAMLMFMLSQPLMSLFRAGQFNSDDVKMVASILQFWVISLPFYSVVMYLYNAFAAIKKFGTFALVSCLAVALQCFLYWILCSPDAILLYGIPLADLCYYVLCAVILLIILKTKIGNFGILNIFWKAVRILVASIIGCMLSLFINQYISTGEINMINGIIVLVIAGGLGLIVTFLLCWAFQVPEIKTLMKKVLKR